LITLRFVAHPGIFTDITRIFQYGFGYTHVDSVTTSGSYLGAMVVGGVRDRPSNYDGGKYLQQTFLKVKTTEDQEKTYFSFLNDQVGKPYDSLSLVTFLGSRNWQNTNGWFCDELVAGGFVACGLFPQHFAVQLNRITVRDLFLLTSTVCEVEDG
jgi:uncharacterized protein YycO